MSEAIEYFKNKVDEEEKEEKEKIKKQDHQW